MPFMTLLKAGTNVGGSPPAFEVDAVDFDLTLSGTPYMRIAGALSGVSDSSTGTFYCFLKTNASATAIAIQNDTQNFELRVNSDGTLTFRVIANGTTSFMLVQTLVTVNDNNWHSVLASWDTNFGPGSRVFDLYVDDASSASVIADSGPAYTVAMSNPNWAIGARYDTSDTFPGALAEVFLDTANRLDLSVTANRRKFISGANKPVDIGSNGSTPIGPTPAIYESVRPGDAASDFATNRGGGGNWTITGSLAISSTSPSD